MTLDGGPEFLGILTEFYNPIELGFSDITGTQPLFICKTIDVAAAADGSIIILGGETYTVREVQPDNTGITRLRVEKQ